MALETSKKFMFLILLQLFILAIWMVYTHTISPHQPTRIRREKYIINTNGCRIFNTDPFNNEAMAYVEKVDGIVCSLYTPLILSNQTSIWMNQTVRENMRLPKNISCFYRSFQRGSPESEPAQAVVDLTVTYGKSCIPFTESANIFDEFIEVVCKYGTDKIVYKDYHAFIVPKRRSEVLPRKSKEERPSVLIIGIDSVSRLNLYRQMPKTLKLLRDYGAIELKGLNKVGDNTFPNLMPFLTGKSHYKLARTCWKYYFDNCTFLWNSFGAKNYLTGFGEDAYWEALFHCEYKGFRQQPTDYYTQPYVKKNEDEIGHKKKINTYLCAGQRPALDIVMSYAGKLAANLTAEDLPFWAFFWGVGMSHDDFNMPPNADNIYESLFASLKKNSALEKTILIFMSDHGMRYGKFRATQQGFFEDRLPFAFFVLPEWFQKKYQKPVHNLRTNTRRLITHYDLHETLVDILDMEQIGNSSTNDKLTSGTSLFEEIPMERTCGSLHIEEHFCACHSSEAISKTDAGVVLAALKVVEVLNVKLKPYMNVCAKLSLDKILSSRTRTISDGKEQLLTLIIQTKPGGGIFESTPVRNPKKNTTSIYSFISRLNAYGNDSYCAGVKLYCYCKSFLSTTSGPPPN